MRLMWAGPWNAQSAIGQFGQDIVALLAQAGHEIDVARTELNEWLALPPRPAPGVVQPVAHFDLAYVRDMYDAVIVNMGNHFGMHGGAMPLLTELAPLVILHDATMDGFYINAEGTHTRVLFQALQAHIGGEQAGIGAIGALASAVIVHGPHYRAPVEAACPGPVAPLPLAFRAAAPQPPMPIGERFHIATVGCCNANKQVREVMRAIAASERLRARCIYLIIGSADDNERRDLLELAAALDIEPPHFTGWVPDNVLLSLLSIVNALCCLRYPLTEGGSASLITALRSGRPTLVSDHGVYAGIPDDLVLKCRPGAEAEDITRHLYAILDMPDAGAAMGA